MFQINALDQPITIYILTLVIELSQVLGGTNFEIQKLECGRRLIFSSASRNIFAAKTKILVLDYKTGSSRTYEVKLLE